jgi:fibronectin-binding autotransporter adhesin
MTKKLHGSNVYYLALLTLVCAVVSLAILPAARGEIVARYAFTTSYYDESTSETKSLESIGNTPYQAVLMNDAHVDNGSVILDGDGDYVDLGYGLGETIEPNYLTGNCSFEVWVTWTGTGELNQRIFDFGNGVGSNSMYLSPNEGTEAPGNLTYALQPVAENNNQALVASGPLSTTLAHIVITYEAARADIGVKTLYVNGQPIASHRPGAAGTPFPSSLLSYLNYLGMSQDSSSPGYLNGSISDFRIWSNLLSADDVLDHYNKGADGLAVFNGEATFDTAANWDTGLVPTANTTAVIVSGTADLNGAMKNVAGLTLLGGTLGDTAGTPGSITSTTAYNLQNGTISAKLAGTVGLTKTSTNTVLLSGANSYSGPTAVDAGTLELGNNGALGDGTSVVTVSGENTILNVSTYNPTVGGFTLTSGTIQGTGTITSATTFDLQSGIVSAKLGGTAGLTKTTTGTVTLNGMNSYTGGTTVSEGVLQLGTIARLGSQVAGNNVTVQSGARLLLGGSNNIGNNQDLFIESGGVVSTAFAVSNTLVGKLGSSGTGVLALQADNTNNLDFSIPSSPVSLGALGDTAWTYSGTLTPFDNTYRLGGGDGTLNFNSNLVDNGATKRSLVAGGGGSGGTVILAGTGNTYSGGTTVVAGTLQVNADSTLGANVADSDVTVNSGGVLFLSADTNIGNNQDLTINAGAMVAISFPITQSLLDRPTPASQGVIAISQSSSDALVFNSGISIGAYADATLSGNITPYNNVYRFAPGKAVLSVTDDLTDGESTPRSVAGSSGGDGSVLLAPDTILYPDGNTYTGGTTVNGGTLQFGYMGMPATGTLTVNDGTANLGGYTFTQTNVVLNGGTISNGTLSSTTDYDVCNGDISASLADYTNPITYEVTPLGLNKTTSGTVYLSGSNTFTGKVVVYEGALRAGNDLALGAIPAETVPDAVTLTEGTILQVNQFDYSATRGLTLAGSATIQGMTGSSIMRFQAPITGPGSLTITGGMAPIGLSGSETEMYNTYEGDTYVTGNTQLRFRGVNALPYGPGKGNLYIESGSNLDVMFSSNVNGLNGEGDVINITGSATTLTVGNNDANGVFSGAIGPDPLTWNNVGLTKVGTGTLILSGTSSYYIRATSISQGTLAVMKLANGGEASSIGQTSAASTNLTIGNDTDTTTGTLKYIGEGDSTDRRFQLGLSGAIDASGTGPINFTPASGMGMGWVGTGVHTLTLTGTNTGDNIMNVRIVDTDDGLEPPTTYATALVKDGPGKWMSTINHLYKGDTTVLDGILDMMDINTPDAAVTVSGGELIAASITSDSLSVGAGAKVTIKALTGGSLANLSSLSAIPEPSTLMLLTMAALATIVAVWRKK